MNGDGARGTVTVAVVETVARMLGDDDAPEGLRCCGVALPLTFAFGLSMGGGERDVP